MTTTKIYFSNVTAETLSKMSREDREMHLNPHNPSDSFLTALVPLYDEIMEAAQTQEKFRHRLHRLMNLAGATKVQATEIFKRLFITFETRPKLVVIMMDSKSYDCHYRVDQLVDYIFLSMETYIKWQSAESVDSMSYESLARRELVKATIIHKLSHVCVSHICRTMEWNLATHNSNDSALEPEVLADLSKTRAAQRKKTATPEKLKVPWNNEGEAGYWMEDQLFGGILSVKESGNNLKFEAAILQVAKEEWLQLSLDMLSHARASVIVHYQTEFADILASHSTVTPSSSIQTQGKGLRLKDYNDEVDEGPAAPRVKCLGVMYGLF
ncbi:hypothetical protein C8J56DRAFT_979712 [Mycena floridula]|nr:hypothetical protein C8J56DRAFT_979712 [Mycena floridula]